MAKRSKAGSTASPSDWRGKDWTDAVPLWHGDHPLQKLVGDDDCEVSLDGGVTIQVVVPALGDKALESMIAGFAAGEVIENIGKLGPFIGLERVAWWYDHDLAED